MYCKLGALGTGKKRIGDNMEKQQYIEKASKYSRKELLAACRSIGLTAHHVKTNKELAEILWQAKNTDKNE